MGTDENFGKGNLGQLGKDAQVLAEHYIGKSARGITNEKLANAFDALLSSAARSRGEDALQTSFPRMGFAGENQTKSSVGTEKLRNLLGYQDDLVQRGYSLPQIKRISAKEAQDIALKDISPMEHPTYKLTAGRTPAGDEVQKTQAFKNLFARWVGKRDSAKTTATQIGSQYKNVPRELGADVIKVMEDPFADVNPQARTYLTPLHKEFDRLYKEAKVEGIDIGYRDNYITHYWDKSNEEVQQAYQMLKQRGGFQNERVFPTYEEGIKMGFKPQYDNPAEIITTYARKIEQLKANIDFFKQLKKQGIIVDAAEGTRLPGYMPLQGVGFPRSLATNFRGEKFIGNYYAPANVAQTINKVFNPQDNGTLGKVAGITGKFSGKLQDLGLSAGIPKTPVNAFAAAQLTKEIMALRVYSPLSSFFRSLSGKASTDFFEANASQIKKMQERNIPVSTSYEISNMIDKGVIKNTFGDKAAGVWDNLMSDPTFKRLLPMLQINFYTDIERQAMRAGKSADEAADIAARAVQKFYGVTRTDADIQRNQLTKDISKTLFFAPRYRESMINFWINNVKAFGNPFAIENRANIKFMVGSALTLATMNYLNEELYGNSLAENPPGKEDKLLIPLDDGTVIGIPFLSSIATVPRAIYREGKMVAEGNISGAVKDAGQTYLSLGLKPLADVAANEDYFGRPIVKDGATGVDAYKQIGGYLGSQYITHPYLKEVTDARSQQDPAYQRLSRAAELPFRFYDQSQFDSSKYYDRREEAFKGLTEEEKKQAEYMLQSSKNNGPNSEIEAEIMIKNPKLMEVKRKMVLGENPNDPLYTRSFDDIRGYLAYQLADDSDSQTKAAIRLKYPWIPQVQYLNTIEMYKKLKGTDYEFELQPPTPLQRMSPEQVKIISLYSALPKGDPRRRTVLGIHSWLKSYWDATEQYYNEHPYEEKGTLAEYLKAENIDLPSSSYGSTGYTARAKKAKSRKPYLVKSSNGSSGKIRVKKTKLTKLKSKAKKNSALAMLTGSTSRSDSSYLNRLLRQA